MVPGIGMWQLLILLMIVIVRFGLKKLGSVGGDLGSAAKGFEQVLRSNKAGQQVVGSDTKWDVAAGSVSQIAS